MRRPLAVLAATVLAVSPARSDLIWYEQVNGDFSNDRLNPTPLTLSAEDEGGSNDIFGRIEGIDPMGNLDRDYFSVTIPAGTALTAIILDTYISTDAAAFMGIHPGPIFPFDPDTVRPEDPLGWTLFGTDSIDADLLLFMSFNGQRFTPPLPAGTYTLWVQQIGELTEYSVNFVVQPIPASPGLACLALGAACALQRRRTR